MVDPKKGFIPKEKDVALVELKDVLSEVGEKKTPFRAS